MQVGTLELVIGIALHIIAVFFYLMIFGYCLCNWPPWIENVKLLQYQTYFLKKLFRYVSSNLIWHATFSIPFPLRSNFCVSFQIAECEYFKVWQSSPWNHISGSGYHGIHKHQDLHYISCKSHNLWDVTESVGSIFSRSGYFLRQFL